MKNEYEYIDPDYQYSNIKTGVLHNRHAIDNRKDLLDFESIVSSQRLDELKRKPVSIKDSNSLLEIHRCLFQDVYDWAGQLRTVEIAKAGKQFFPLSHFQQALLYIDTLLKEYRGIKASDVPKLAAKLADILDTVNFLHPFREGNGRTQREFIRTLALEKGYELNLNPADNIDVYERYMGGTINGDITLLAALILDTIKKI
jgi:cell filamentation protein